MVRSTELTAGASSQMIHLDCPGCDAPIPTDLGVEELACDVCLVRVEIAPDPEPRGIPVAA